MNIGIVSLGCAKNQVDLEEILAYLKANGFETVSDPALADIILVNTCGFIESAKKESIDAILEMVSYKKPVVVTGCLATRYLEELKKSQKLLYGFLLRIILLLVKSSKHSLRTESLKVRLTLLNAYSSRLREKPI